MELKGLNKLNFTTLAWIVIFLQEIIKYEEQNLMTENNICLMFAPNLFKLKDSDPQ